MNNPLSSPSKCVIDITTRITDHSKNPIDPAYVNDDKHSSQWCGLKLTEATITVH